VLGVGCSIVVVSTVALTGCEFCAFVSVMTVSFRYGWIKKE